MAYSPGSGNWPPPNPSGGGPWPATSTWQTIASGTLGGGASGVSIESNTVYRLVLTFPRDVPGIMGQAASTALSGLGLATGAVSYGNTLVITFGTAGQRRDFANVLTAVIVACWPFSLTMAIAIGGVPWALQALSQTVSNVGEAVSQAAQDAASAIGTAAGQAATTALNLGPYVGLVVVGVAGFVIYNLVRR